MHEDTRFIMVRATGRHNTLCLVHINSCIMQQFALGGYKWAREGSMPQVSDVSMDVLI